MKHATSTNELKALLKFGNRKLPKTTMIFNMGPATGCPSAQLGMCKIPKGCYARKAEITYPEVLPYRKRQAEYWKTRTADQIIKDIDDILSRKRNKVTAFRYNEAGDFYTQDDVIKLDQIAIHLKARYNIVTYGYTARRDLQFDGMSFRCKGSGHTHGNHGITTVVPKHAEAPAGFVKCPGSCKKCKLCLTRKAYNIAFEKH